MDEYQGDKRIEDERDEASEKEVDADIAIPLGIPDHDGQMRETWLNVREVLSRVESLEQQVTQLTQKLNTVQGSVQNANEHLSLHGTSVAVMVGSILAHMGIDPSSGLPKD